MKTFEQYQKDAQSRPHRNRLISSLRVEHKGGHYHVGVWIHGARSGELVVTENEVEELILRLAGPETIIERHVKVTDELLPEEPALSDL